MSRKKIRKNFANKTINPDVGTENKQDDFLKQFGKTLAGVLAILLIIFAVLNTFMDNDTEEDIVEDIDYTEELGYNKILAQDAFDKSDEEYVVFFINGEEGKDEVNDYFKSLSEGVFAPKVYVVDMAESVNSKYLVDDSELKEKYGDNATVEYEKEPSKIEELEVYNFPTILHITDGEFTAFYEGDAFYEAFGITNPDNAEEIQN